MLLFMMLLRQVEDLHQEQLAAAVLTMDFDFMRHANFHRGPLDAVDD